MGWAVARRPKTRGAARSPHILVCPRPSWAAPEGGRERGQREVTEARMWGESGRLGGGPGESRSSGRPGLRAGLGRAPSGDRTGPRRACLEATRPGKAAVPGAEQEGPARRWPAQGGPRACGACSRERFLSETKAYFFRRHGLCSYLMTSPWPGAQSRRRGGLAGGRLEPSPARSPRPSLSGPRHQSGGLS